ncbi:hypothetical protein [Borreliella lusitaniae]|uniref:hypothetical protein n=1 Tax=Borreliella lusitaniae TaxID=100177 RepID=UPI003C73B5EE
MNKKMFIICVVLFLISSCKNDESKEEKSLDNILDDIELEVEKLVQADEAPEQAENKAAGAVGVGVGAAAGAGAGAAAAGAGAGAAAGGGDNIKEKIAELKKKINRANSKNTSIGKYREYQEEVKKLREELKGNGNNGNGGNSENELKDLEESLTKKKDDRKKELADSKKKFEEFKRKVDAATGVTDGDQAKKKGQIGVRAFNYAKALSLNVKIDKNSDDTKELVNQVINGAIKKIEEELEVK